MTPLAAEARYYRELDEADAREMWIANYIAEKTTDRKELAEAMVTIYDRVEPLLFDLLCAEAGECASLRDDIAEVFTEYFRTQGEAEYRKQGECYDAQD